jgi:hypothetical protein
MSLPHVLPAFYQVIKELLFNRRCGCSPAPRLAPALEPMDL